ncbi:c-type cytochrome [Stieleria mannarensis]|uniref:c-type cytochrome n=1 Tax=Stieleria mannarensis TaxID=2755585 RepID=UPI0015FFE62D|nr:c-type cytochrome [Rhodopirellula sp. JC639]
MALASETDARSTSAASMVSGFDRFARHRELPESVAGSLLISELSCVACHAADDPWLEPKRGPRLSGAGIRLQPQWIRAYLANPSAAKPTTTMPHALALVPDSQRDAAIDALVAFLGSQQQPFPVIKAGGALPVIHEFWKRGDVDRGNKLYHTVGCVACHDPDPDYETVESKPSAIDELLEQLDPEEIEDLGLASEARRVDSVPHSELPDKYSLRSLTMMLLDPTKTRPSARMPSLRLSPLEAADIASYLLRDQASRSTEIDPTGASQELIETGRELFVRLSCVACHDATGVQRVAVGRPLRDLNPAAAASCLDAPVGQMARYTLDDEQRSAILARLGDHDIASPTAAADVDYRMLQLNCYGCHRRDDRGGVGRYRKAYFETVGHVDLGDEGKLPPTLGGVGRKLTPKALAAVFYPKTPSHRPFMTARMPSYSSETVSPLIAGFPIADRSDNPDAMDLLPPDEAMAQAGRDLINTGCVGCHSFRGESLPGVVGIDLAGTTNRIEPKWFYEFVLNPSAVKKRTRMPTFFPDGKSNRPELLGGDVQRQISAIWAYLKFLDKQPLPEKIETVRSANYELLPREKPIVLRTFMQQAGTHAIAVGFPQGIHYAFDAERVRLAVGWKQRFLDARGTWFERFTPPADPLGDALVQMPTQPLFVHGDDLGGSPAYRFGGYRLDDAGVPTFLYDVDGVRVEDRIEAVDHKTLKRTVTMGGKATGKPLALRVHSAKRLQSRGRSGFTDDQGLMIRLREEVAQYAALIQTDQQTHWQLPLENIKSSPVVLEYRW